MLKLFTKKHRGFTLIELLVVIAIIGILSSIVLVSMGGARKSARDANRKSDMSSITTAQEMYYGYEEQYFESTGATWPTSISTYLPKTPVDPSSTKSYVWIDNETIAGNEQFFCVYAILETPATPVTYITASEQGNFQCTVLPTLAACCH